MSRQYILPFKRGQKILEVGGGESPIFRPNADFRKLSTVDIVCDLEKRFPIEDESYAGVLAKFVIEHISWRRVPHFISEIYRILKPGGLAVVIGPNTFEQCREIMRRGKIGIEESALLFGGQEGSWEETGNYHKSAFSFEYVQKLFKEAGFSEVVTKPLPGCHTDMVIEAHKGTGRDPLTRIKQSEWYKDLRDDLVGKPEKGLKLNVGSFTVMIPGFINIDILDLSKYAKEKGFLFEQVDVRYGLPYKDNTVKFINISHLIEHLSQDEARYFLKECRRVLTPKGRIRIGTPDLRKLVTVYLKRDMDKFDQHQPEEYRNAPSQADRFWRMLTPGHKTIYDYEALSQLLRESGFKPRRAKYDKRYDMYPDHTLYVTAKPLKAIAPRKHKLRIALVSTPFMKVFPKTYGGLECVVGNLAEALSEMGHDVTVFAPNGSKVKGCKIVEFGVAIRKVQVNWLEAEKKSYQVYKSYLKDFDVIHSHTWFHFPYLAKIEDPKLRVCATHHGHLNFKTKPPGIEKMNLIAISRFMAEEYSGILNMHVRWVYNGIDLNLYRFSRNRGDRLLYVGRFTRFKGAHVAVEVAEKTGLGLDLVGGSKFITQEDQTYFEGIKKRCDGKRITLYPDATHEVKVKLMQNCKCLLFPSMFKEPFGLVGVEANACGAPVIALRDGAIPEIILNEVNGYVCNSAAEMVAMVGQVNKIKPENCRTVVEENFSRQIMAKRYLKNYRDVTHGREW